MTALVVEHTVTCPSCWEPHTVTIDISGEERRFIEDCRVCCNPMQLRFGVADGRLTHVDVEPAT